MTTTASRSPFIGTLTDTSHLSSIEGVMAHAGLDYNVTKVNVFSEPILTPDGVTTVQFGSDAGIVGWLDDGQPTPYRTVGARYEILQNRDAFGPAQYLWDEGFITGIEQAGRTHNGQKAYMLARLAEECRLSDKHEKYILFTTTHDGSGAFTARGLMRRLSCANQLPSIFGSRRDVVVRVRHFGKNDRDIAAEVRTALLTSVLPAFAQYEEAMSQPYMHDPMGIDEIERYANNLFPYRPDVVEHIIERGDLRYDELTTGQKRSVTMTLSKRTALHSLATGEGNGDLVGTRAGLFQAAVEWSDYHSSGNRGLRILGGEDARFKRRALDIALSI